MKRLRSSANQSGAALLLTLFFMVLLTIVVIGFLTSMQMEVAAASSDLGGIRADIFAREGEDIARARLYSAFTNSTQPWLSQPGAVYSPVTNLISLESGPQTPGGTVDQEVDLNPTSLVNSSQNLIGTNSAMVVQWIYQFQDGTYSTNLAAIPPPYSRANPVVGRIGFWVDDESAKLNINTAAVKAATNQIYNPAQVNLGTNANDPANVIAYRNSLGGFNSIYELGRATNVSSGLLGQPFSLTAYNHSPVPRLNMLGQQPILLTTQQSVAQACGYTNYLNILNTPNTDPGAFANLNSSSVNTAIANIIGGLTSSQWPIMPGKSFKDKYPDVASIAANIIEYVRNVESTNLLVEPLQGNSSLAPSYSEGSAPNPNGGWVAVGRHPVISQMSAFFPTAPYNILAGGGQSNYFNAYVGMQLYFPPVAGGWNNNGAGIPLSDLAARVDVGIFWPQPGGGTLSGNVLTFTQNSGPFNSEDYPTPASTNIMPGGYALIVNGHQHAVAGDPVYRPMGPLPPNKTVVQDASAPYNMFIQLNVQLMSAESGAFFSTLDNQTGNLPMTSQSTSTNQWVSGNPQTVAIDDPSANYWHLLWTNAADIMGTTNHTYSTLGKPPSLSGIAQQDTDANGNLAEGVVVPAPKGTPQNPYGLVQSLGELGFIHTGNSGATQPDVVPWRTIRLQPEKSGSTDLPDWLMMELFAVPSTNVVTPINHVFVQPNVVASGPTTNVYAVGGKVNLNANLLPFPNYPSRLLPLESVLTGMSNNAAIASAGNVYTLPSSGVPTVATNILGQVLASQSLGSVSNQGRLFTNTALTNEVYYSPGQVAEIAGVADSGEASEEMVRQLVAQTTVRGDVFTINSIGQSVKQDITGQIHVQGESRRQATVERAYQSDGTIHVQTVSSNRLQP
jgi:hypothetical protein